MKLLIDHDKDAGTTIYACAECHRDAKVVVRLGRGGFRDGVDDDASVVSLHFCLACLNRGVALLENNLLEGKKRR
jgi:hypothetical protein